MLMVLLVLGTLWYVIHDVATPISRTALDRAHNAKVLALAKQALIGYVAAQAADESENYPGRLPCPEPGAYVGDPNNEGTAAPGPGAPTCSSVGRLPWRTLGVDELRDASGEPLWYVVTTGTNGWALQNSSTALSINSNKLGGLAVDGRANAAVAVIIAPGPPLSLAPDASQVAGGCAARVQTRGTTPPNYLDYLECQDITGGSLHTSVPDNAVNPVFNDQMVTITAAEILAAIEGPVAKRIQTDVVPELQGGYDSAQWGASSSTPIYPFAATFMDPSLSTYKGVAGTSQGLLPITAYTCNALTSGHCDPSFVSWNTGTISVSKVSGGASLSSWNCSSSTTSLMSCNVTFIEWCGSSSTCTPDIRVQIQATASNVGMTLRTLTTSGTTGGSAPTLVAPLQTDGSAAAIYKGSLTGTSFTCGGSSCSSSSTRTITIPITVFKDHPLLSPTSTDPWYWFIANKWYQVTYYAVAQSQLPSGSPHDCLTVGDCLSVTGLTPSTNLQAILVLAGRSLTGATRPNGNLADFLDTSENQNLDNKFEQNRISKTFNDRFVIIDNY